MGTGLGGFWAGDGVGGQWWDGAEGGGSWGGSRAAAWQRWPQDALGLSPCPGWWWGQWGDSRDSSGQPGSVTASSPTCPQLPSWGPQNRDTPQVPSPAAPCSLRRGGLAPTTTQPLPTPSLGPTGTPTPPCHHLARLLHHTFPAASLHRTSLQDPCRAIPATKGLGKGDFPGHLPPPCISPIQPARTRDLDFPAGASSPAEQGPPPPPFYPHC